MAKKRFLLRLDPEIYEALERWSQDELRSVNAQIEYLLRQALKEHGRLQRSSSKVASKEASLTNVNPKRDENSSS